MASFADNSRRSSPWAAKIYTDARASGKDHAHAIRITVAKILGEMAEIHGRRAADTVHEHEWWSVPVHFELDGAVGIGGDRYGGFLLLRRMGRNTGQRSHGSPPAVYDHVRTGHEP